MMNRAFVLPRQLFERVYRLSWSKVQAEADKAGISEIKLPGVGFRMGSNEPWPKVSADHALVYEGPNGVLHLAEQRW